jgi:hypothetical protein
VDNISGLQVSVTTVNGNEFSKDFLDFFFARLDSQKKTHCLCFLKSKNLSDSWRKAQSSFPEITKQQHVYIINTSFYEVSKESGIFLNLSQNSKRKYRDILVISKDGQDLFSYRVGNFKVKKQVEEVLLMFQMVWTKEIEKKNSF